MTTHFITAEVDRQETTLDLPAAIDAQLQQHGEPLRWAITAVTEHTAQVEAVVTTEADTESGVEPLVAG